MLHCKLQFGCMLILLYLVFMYRIERKKFRQKGKWSIFDGLFSVAIGCVFFDGYDLCMHSENFGSIINVRKTYCKDNNLKKLENSTDFFSLRAKSN